MAYIWTSKTRRTSPHGKTVVIRHKDTGERRICDERAAERKHAKHPGSGWSEPCLPGTQTRVG